jgi:hypothetical protein
MCSDLDSTKLLKAFLLEIEGAQGQTHECFLFNVSESNWTSHAISSSPRFHFSTESVFRFSQKYEVTIYSLPEPWNRTTAVQKTVVMPQHPSLAESSNQTENNCTRFSHPYASKWSAGFRRISLHSLAKTIEIEFVGAPTQYCFEQYEVRLLDESGLELLHSDIISTEQMRTETVGNSTLLFGQYNFTGLDFNKSYIPSVIAVERASDGRCLCPVYGASNNPYDNKVVCSCIAADWKPVRLQRYNLTEPLCKGCANTTIPTAQVIKEESSSWKFYMAMLAGIVFTALSAIALSVLARHYRKSGKTVRIRFIQDQHHHADHLRPADRKSLLENGSAVLAQTPLILSTHINVLIVYSHDSGAHNASVAALAEFLREVCNIDVHIDQLDEEIIERNLMDYLSSSVVNADKVIVINSIGANHRYHEKISGSDYVVERNEHEVLDNLFLLQIDMALQHQCVISMRFDYSSFNDVLPPLHGYLQYVVPDNLVPFVSAIVGRNVKHDPRFSGYHPQLNKLQTAIRRMNEIQSNQPQWFRNSHCRRPLKYENNGMTAVSVTEQLPAAPSPLPIVNPVDTEKPSSDIFAESQEELCANVEPDTNAPESGVFDVASLATEDERREVYNIDDGLLLTEEVTETSEKERVRNGYSQLRPSSPLDSAYITTSQPSSPNIKMKNNGFLPVAAKSSADDSNNDSGFLETRSELDLRMISAS